MVFLAVGSKKIFASPVAPPVAILQPAPVQAVLGTQTPQNQTPSVATSTPTASSVAPIVPTQPPSPAATKNFVTITGTPTGYLNVRDQPSLGGNIISKVYPGQTYPYSQSQNGWYLIKLTDGHYGWIDGQYTGSGSKINRDINNDNDSE